MNLTFPITNSTLRWLEIIFAQRYAHSWHMIRTEAGLCLQLDGAEGAIIFDVLLPAFTQAHSNQPCTQWDAQREGWQSVLGSPLPAPGVSTLPSPLIESRGSNIHIHYDIPGLTYWMLARVEEIGRTDLDHHQRFPATSSHAYHHGYLDRPVVDEWLHILGQVIQRQWPGITLKQHKFRMRVSHDVDNPYQHTFTNVPLLTRNLAGDLIKRRSLGQGLSRLRTWGQVKQGNLAADPFNTFDWLMNLSDQHGLTSAFYFITDHTDPHKDGNYSIRHPLIRQLLRHIHQRGHEIGLHPSFNTYQNPTQTKKELKILQQVCAEEGIQQPTWGGRQHFLRWQNPTTWQNWEQASLSYDSTLSFADAAGFRCGTCYEFPVFDLETRQPLHLVERPLVVMECTVLDPRYMGLGQNIEDALDCMKSLKDTCRRFNGEFTLLWHNSNLTTPENRWIYEQILVA